MPNTTSQNLDQTRLTLSAKCVQCGRTVFGPEWSENIADGACIHIWQCPVCNYEFETTDNVVERTESVGELAEEFFSNLLVA